MIAVMVEIGVGALVDKSLLERVGGFVALVDFHAIADAAHFKLRDRCSLAGVNVLGRENYIELSIFFDDVALADVACNNRNHRNDLCA